MYTLRSTSIGVRVGASVGHEICPVANARIMNGLIWHKDVPATLGRANPAGYRVLYLADRIDTALKETHIADDPAVVSEFSIREHHNVRIAPIGEFT
jgi:hypothetical protein